VADRAHDDSPSNGGRAVLDELAGLEETIRRHREGLAAGSWHPTSGELVEALQHLADRVAATRRSVEALQQAQRDERRRLGHDMRAALNTIAGWAHILRLERNPSERVARAADVLDRNVRALAGVIESTDR